MSLLGRLRHRLTPSVGQLAPGPTSAVVHRALDGAIRGVGPLRGAARAADRQLARSPDDVDHAVRRVVARHVRLAGAQGFVTNLGGLVTLAATVPANIAGLALIQCRMVAAIAHLHGHDLAEPRVRNAVLVCVIGEEQVDRLVKRGSLPGTPSAIAADAGPGGQLDRVVGAQVATALVARVGGKRLVTTVGRRVPLVGGAVGASADAFSTWRLGRYAARQFSVRP